MQFKQQQLLSIFHPMIKFEIKFMCFPYPICSTQKILFKYLTNMGDIFVFNNKQRRTDVAKKKNILFSYKNE